MPNTFYSLEGEIKTWPPWEVRCHFQGQGSFSPYQVKTYNISRRLHPPFGSMNSLLKSKRGMLNKEIYQPTKSIEEKALGASKFDKRLVLSFGFLVWCRSLLIKDRRRPMYICIHMSRI